MQEDMLKTLKQIASGANFSVNGAAISATNPLPVTEATLLAGEDLTNNVIKTEERFSPFYWGANATTTIVKSGSGFIHALNIPFLSCPSLTLYDSLTASGTVIFQTSPNTAQASYLLDETFATGLTMIVAGGGSASINIPYR